MKGQYYGNQPLHLPNKSKGGGGAEDSPQHELVHQQADGEDIKIKLKPSVKPSVLSLDHKSPYHQPIAHQDGGGEDHHQRKTGSKSTSIFAEISKIDPKYSKMGPQLCPHSIPSGVGATAAVSELVTNQKPTDSHLNTQHHVNTQHHGRKQEGGKVQRLINNMFEKKSPPTRIERLDQRKPNVM